jgi:hypothetical protein
MLKLSKAPIPADTIGLADAFKRVCERLADWHKIISETEAISAERESKNIRYSERSSTEALNALDAATDSDFSPEQNEVVHAGEQLKLLVLRQHWRKVEADRIMREALASGELVAKIENPRTGEPRELNNIRRWLPPRDLPRASAPNYLKLPPATTHHDIEYGPGFRSDYVEEWDIKKPMPDQPGPPTDFDDQTLHRVFFDEEDFKKWLGGEDAQAQTFTPYPPLDEATMAMPKVKVAREMLELRWPEGSPDKLSVQKMAELTTKKFNSRGRVVLNGRGNRITVITEDDIKRALGRK